MDVMLDFICMGPVDLPGARRKRKNTKWKISCPQWDSNPQTFDSKSDALPDWASRLGECHPFKWPYISKKHTCTPDTNVNIIISTRMTKDSVLCLVNVLFCVTYWNIIYKCCTNSKETHKSCACFQHANTAKHSAWSGICTLKASTGPMRLFVICKIYIYSNM